MHNNVLTNPTTNNAERRLSVVKMGKVAKWMTTERPKIAKVLLAANFQLICRTPTNTKGVLIKRMMMARSIWKISEINMEVPVTPPSMKWLGNKNPLIPSEARKIPNNIDKILPSILAVF